MASDRGQFEQTNQEYAFLAIIILVPVVMGLMWHFAGRYIYAWERIALYGALSGWGSFPTNWPVLGFFTRQFLFFWNTPAQEITYFGDAVRESLVINAVFVVVVLLLFIKRFLYIMEHHPYSRFGRTLNLYDFMFQQMPLYPHLKVMWKLRLLARPLRDGLFRIADSEKAFATRNEIIRLASEGGEPVLDERKAKRVFERQLGVMMPMPTNDPQQDARNLIARLSNDEKAVLAAVLPRLAVCDADVADDVFKAALAKSDELLKQFWVGFFPWDPELPTPEQHMKNPDMPLVPPPPPVNTQGCDEVLMKYMVFPRVRETMLAHAYVRTFIYDAFQAKTRVGKCASTKFRWLKFKDRELWMVISSAGRNTPFWEAAGLHAHFLWERKAKCATEKPHVEEAVTALRDEFDERTVFDRNEKKRIWLQQGSQPRIPLPPPKRADPASKPIARAVVKGPQPAVKPPN